MIRVIGAGVSGLTCAVALREAGYDAHIVTRDDPLETVSAVAAALWYPLRAEMDDATQRRIEGSFEVFTTLAGDPATGIVLRDGIEIFRSAPPDDAWWEGSPKFVRATLKGAHGSIAWERLPVIEMPVYLRYLVDRFEASGGTVQRREVASLDQAFEDTQLVVNCSGLGARTLAADPSMVPIRGQVVRLENPGIDRFVLDEANPAGRTYIIPRRNDVVCGGTREAGSDSLEIDPSTEEQILARCIALEPRLKGARILSRGVGLRPGREHVRLESEAVAPGKLVVHNYGHSGSGVTLSWGCATEVVALVTVAHRR